MSKVYFAQNFLFGVATSSTQIEGGDTNNSWYNWTKDGNKTKDGSNCLRANLHWSKYKDHIDLMSDMKLQVYRFSLEWSRIEPKQGEFDSKALRHYVEEIKYLKSKNIEPLITLHHFSNPIWFEELGGFLKKKNIKYFIEYVEYIAKNLGEYANEYCTINEPNIYARNCYLNGTWVNEQHSVGKFFKVMRHLSLAHIGAYTVLHKHIPDAKVGYANNIQHFIPENKNNVFQKMQARFFTRTFNDCIMYAMNFGQFKLPLGIRGRSGEYFDFVGINYYTTTLVSKNKSYPNPKALKNDLGWAIDSNGLREECKKYANLFSREIYITENGIADEKDVYRSQFLFDHLKAVHDLPYVTRYYHWTLMDNFEWKEGESACFGLVQYHYKDGSFTPRESSKFYTEVIQKHYIDDEMISHFNIIENSSK